MTGGMGTWAADMVSVLDSLFAGWETLLTAGIAIGLGIRYVPRLIRRFS